MIDFTDRPKFILSFLNNPHMEVRNISTEYRTCYILSVWSEQEPNFLISLLLHKHSHMSSTLLKDGRISTTHITDQYFRKTKKKNFIINNLLVSHCAPEVQSKVHDIIMLQEMK